MKNSLVWEERFNIGVDVIDKEHKKLFSIINKLFAFSENEKKSQWVCQEGIKYFKDHAMKHFADEEYYMESINYSEMNTHKRIHDDFKEKILPTLEQELEQTEYSESAVNHFLGVCTGWLIGHTLTEDQAITGKFKSRWNKLLEEEAYVAMKQAVLQLVYELFQLDAKAVSESYGGEKFGNGIYYRLIYSDDKNNICETILVFEESLLINSVGKIMGIKTDKVDIMLINTVRYVSRQFVNCIMENFQSTSRYKIQAENLLTYEQFKKIYERRNPQFSMLFDTGVGYFAYCIIAPHLNESGIGASIKVENAMAEIEQYLKINEESQNEINKKKKVLVVDDSSVMQVAINEVLKEDYDVTFVNSGLSAIRSITLNKPNLILLDYEMPICNGKQVLEMIRSEKDFKNIPVIFLTGRVDKESVKQVLSLKPEGYLSKSLNPLEIKHNVDDYFNKTANAN